MHTIDFGSWQGVLTTLLGVALFALVGIGIRLLIMSAIQRRRERLNRQINERLRTLISAYKVLGGSFTGNLAVDPRHLRDLRAADVPAAVGDDIAREILDPTAGSDRRRRIRDAVEAALSDVILLGTEAQVRLAERAARELAAGNPIHTHALVVSLRDFIRKALDLDPIPSDLAIPAQGPARPSASGGRGRGDRSSDGTRHSARGEGGRGGMGGSGTGGGVGGGLAIKAILDADEPDRPF